MMNSSNHVEDITKEYTRFKSFNELIEALTSGKDTPVTTSETAISVVCLSSTIRVATSSLYTVNRRTKRTVVDEYLVEAVKLILSINPSVRVVIPKDQLFVHSNNTSFRETLSKDFSLDIIMFARSGLSLQAIYKYYSGGSADDHIRARISQAEALIEKLGFLRRNRVPLSPEAFLITALRVHPLIAKIILIWMKEMNKPLFPIILFTAVIHSCERGDMRETKEHGLKEVESSVSSNSKYGEMMEKTLSIIKATGQIDTPELGRIGVVLRRLFTKAKEYFSHSSNGEATEVNVKIATFDLDRFTVLLVELLRTHFNDRVLTRIPDGSKTGTVLFRSVAHPHIMWRVDNNPPFQQIFPVISMLERNGNHILLFVPM